MTSDKYTRLFKEGEVTLATPAVPEVEQLPNGRVRVSAPGAPVVYEFNPADHVVFPATGIRRTDRGAVHGWDPDTGDEYAYRALFVEAVGTDGMIHGFHVATAPTGVTEEVLERMWLSAEQCLIHQMERAGVQVARPMDLSGETQ